MFITFEGIDGCGKSTQARRLARWLEQQGIPCVLTSEPWELKTRLQVATAKSALVQAVLFNNDRRQHLQKQVIPALESGRTVVCDRFSDSMIAYQGYGQGVDVEWLKALVALSCYGVEPDVTFWLDCPVEVACARLAARGEVSDREFLERVRRGYQALAAAHPRIVRVDATAEPDVVHAGIVAWLEETGVGKGRGRSCEQPV